MSDPSAGSRLKSSITEASRKIEGIIDDAERAAAEIRADAQADAQRQAQSALNERSAELAGVVQPLVERVEVLRTNAAELMEELETVTNRLLEMTKGNALLKVSPDAGEDAPAERSEMDRAEPVEPASAPPPPLPPAPAVESAPPGPTPIAYPGTSTSSSEAPGPPEEAVLRATQMAVAGSPRSDIELALRDEFELDDPGSVVDDILGPA